jgi:pilus assembly protein Flp/PilA
MHAGLHARSVAMKSFASVISAFLADESGQDIVEYALVAAFIALFAIAGLQKIATAASSVLTNVGSRLTSAI